MTSSTYSQDISCPSILERTCSFNGTKKGYVVWSSDTKDIWDHWWSKTTWRSHNPTIKIGWSTARRKSNVWKYFRSIARISDGTPLLQCIRCQQIFKHSGILQSGTSTLTRHLQRPDCIRISKNKGLCALDRYLQREKVSLGLL